MLLILMSYCWTSLPQIESKRYVQLLLLTVHEMHTIYQNPAQSFDRSTTYLEPALIFTVSFTCSMVGFAEVVGAAASFFPPDNEVASNPVKPKVPRARYSFLMARPKIMLFQGHLLASSTRDG